MCIPLRILRETRCRARLKVRSQMSAVPGVMGGCRDCLIASTLLKMLPLFCETRSSRIMVSNFVMKEG